MHFEVTDLQELCRPLFRLSSDLPDHDDAFRVGIVEEHVEAVQEIGAVEGVAPNADAEGLPEANLKKWIQVLDNDFLNNLNFYMTFAF